MYQSLSTIGQLMEKKNPLTACLITFHACDFNIINPSTMVSFYIDKGRILSLRLLGRFFGLFFKFNWLIIL